jgi:4-hydroxy-3-polyprenylbenzoate decarboxylase
MVQSPETAFQHAPRRQPCTMSVGCGKMPPVPAFYARPATIDGIVNHSVGRALDLFGLENKLVRRWGEEIGIGS